MSRFAIWLGFVLALAASLYQFLSGPGSTTHDVLGVGRVLNYTSHGPCTPIPELEACEDMWMHRPSGLLYLACSDIKGRSTWTPAERRLDTDGRPETDYVAILDTKASGPFHQRITKVKPSSYNGTLNLHGISIFELPAQAAGLKPTLRVFLNNHRPPMDPFSGFVMDASKVGANSTVELFETVLGEGHMRHIRTYASPAIRTPNRPAASGPDSFVFTNDHGNKAGWRRTLEFLRPRGDLGYCDLSGCRIASPGPWPYPNGVVKSTKFQNRYYVPASADPNIRVFELQADNTLTLIDVVYTGYPSDNLTVDEEDNIYTASFPDVRKLLAKFGDPLKKRSPTTVLKLSRGSTGDRRFGNSWKVEKVMEDIGTGMSGATTALWDSEQGGLWLGGVVSVTSFCKV